jgi:putative acetyltransferase
MIIREEIQEDHAAIADVTAKAFADMKYSDQIEPMIIGRLREAGALALSLVGIDHGDIVGQATFSPITIDEADIGWFGLGPVSVRPDRQGQGIGGLLIRQGLNQLRARGAAGCVVLGDPAYYQRFGYENDEALRYVEAPSQFFMRLSFVDNVPAGRVQYHPAFGAAVDSEQG